MPREGIMLAHPFEERRFRRWGSEAIAQPKINGNRCRAILSEEGVVLLSSQANTITSVPHINAQLAAFPFYGELDGELYIHGWPLEEIRSVVGRSVDFHPDYELVTYHVFDIITSQPQTERLKTLATLPHNAPSVEVVPSTPVDSIEAITRLFAVYIEAGYEGCVLRKLDGLYERKRSTSLMKLKLAETDIYTIVGVEEEYSIHGEPKNSLGALICQDEDGRTFNVGTGFLREERQLLWAKQDDLIGRRVVVEYQDITSTGSVPRHSRFVRLEVEHVEA